MVTPKGELAALELAQGKLGRALREAAPPARAHRTCLGPPEFIPAFDKDVKGVTTRCRITEPAGGSR